MRKQRILIAAMSAALGVMPALAQSFWNPAKAIDPLVAQALPGLDTALA